MLLLILLLLLLLRLLPLPQLLLLLLLLLFVAAIAAVAATASVATATATAATSCIVAVVTICTTAPDRFPVPDFYYLWFSSPDRFHTIPHLLTPRIEQPLAPALHFLDGTAVTAADAIPAAAADADAVGIPFLLRTGALVSAAPV